MHWHKRLKSMPTWINTEQMELVTRCGFERLPPNFAWKTKDCFSNRRRVSNSNRKFRTCWTTTDDETSASSAYYLSQSRAAFRDFETPEIVLAVHHELEVSAKGLCTMTHTLSCTTKPPWTIVSIITVDGCQLTLENRSSVLISPAMKDKTVRKMWKEFQFVPTAWKSVPSLLQCNDLEFSNIVCS